MVASSSPNGGKDNSNAGKADASAADEAVAAKAATLAVPGSLTKVANTVNESTPENQASQREANTNSGVAGWAERDGRREPLNGDLNGGHRSSSSIAGKVANVKPEAAIRFAHLAEQLSLLPHNDHDETTERTTAVRARFITPRDPVIETASGERLPAVPLAEAQRLNQLKDQITGMAIEESAEEHRMSHTSCGSEEQKALERANEARAMEVHREDCADQVSDEQIGCMPSEGTEYAAGGPHHASLGFGRTGAPLNAATPPSRTNPLFPPLPLYGPPTLFRNIQCLVLRFTSFWLSLGFLMVIVLGSAFTSIPLMFRHIGIRLTFRNPDARRPFREEEKRRAAARKKAESDWKRNRRRRSSIDQLDPNEEKGGESEEFIPTEGGKDPLRSDLSYYARRVGLDMEEFKVHTEDGFIISLWHVYNPREYTAATMEERQKGRPEVFPEAATHDPDASPSSKRRKENAPKRYPVLLIHGLLQSAGAYCSNDDDSLAFYLAKSGYDVWLGNNRCGFNPEHTLLSYGDPRLWCFNIRQMGVMDLPALISRVLTETGFPKLGLVCHSQGTTETFVALAKEQRPDLGQRISVFCALAPAVYAGPLIGKMYFKFMKVISPSMFRIFFGIHAFIPFMMTMQHYLPPGLYGAMGYRVFSFLFNWTDTRWDRGLRDRMFRFSPVYVSAESMRWWLGRECFAKHKCILATREEVQKEEAEDAANRTAAAAQNQPSKHAADAAAADEAGNDSEDEEYNLPQNRGRRAWYDKQVPPMALWVAGSDELVDGRRLLRRFESGREPHVKIVHTKVIEEYEHLDVLWAVDVIQQVGQELKTVIWQSTERMEGVAVPRGCNEVVGEMDEAKEKKAVVE